MRLAKELPPLVLHVVYRLATGGIENGLVNLINHMAPGRYRHAVLALTDITDFSQRILRPNVDFYALNKSPGHGVWLYPKLFKLFRQLKPAIVHSRNLAALEVQAPAWAAGVPVRLHGEHGRDMADLKGDNVNFQRTRRFYKNFVHHYTSLTPDLTHDLIQKIQVAPASITQTSNGVDTTRFHPASAGPQPIAGCPFRPDQHWLVGTVGRMQAVKDPVMLAQAFVQALTLNPVLQQRMRLVMVGEGPLRVQAQTVLNGAGFSHLAWLPGERGDVADIMRGLHLFALPSLAEGMCNTVLEAMASALPVIATAVGGNGHLVVPGLTGLLVDAGVAEPMALQLITMATQPELAQSMGQAGRQRVLEKFSLQSMVAAYATVYDQQLLCAHSPLRKH
jgi:sugar transferase (PEP-CTERM/EpsH1 system associated)